MIPGRKCNSAARQQGGMTLIELMIAMVVLAIGILAAMGLILTAVSGNSRSRQGSSSTALAQMVTERIMAVPANSTAVLTITDCTATAYNVSTAVGGAGLTASGDVDYTQAVVANYNMPYTDCATGGRQATYDVRWNVQAIGGTSFAKLLTVSARLKSTSNNNRVVFAPVVTIRTIVGQGT